MRIPKHIKEAALKLKKISVENRIEEKSADEILSELEKDLTFYEKVEVINSMMDLASYLEYETGEVIWYNLFRKSKIQRGLKKKLREAKIKRPELTKEVDDLLEFIKAASKFEISWSQDDSADMIREFKFINTLEEWNELMQKSKGRVDIGEITLDILGKKIYEHIKIVHVSNSFWEEKVQKHKEKLIKEMGHRKFWNGYYRYFEIWYNQFIRGTYYIFIPEE